MFNQSYLAIVLFSAVLILISCSKDGNYTSVSNSSKPAITMSVNGSSVDYKDALSGYSKVTVDNTTIEGITVDSRPKQNQEGISISIIDNDLSVNKIYHLSERIGTVVCKKLKGSNIESYFIDGVNQRKGHFQMKILKITDKSTSSTVIAKDLEVDFSGVLYNFAQDDSVIISNGRARY